MFSQIKGYTNKRYKNISNEILKLKTFVYLDALNSLLLDDILNLPPAGVPTPVPIPEAVSANPNAVAMLSEPTKSATSTAIIKEKMPAKGIRTMGITLNFVGLLYRILITRLLNALNVQLLVE